MGIDCKRTCDGSQLIVRDFKSFWPKQITYEHLDTISVGVGEPRHLASQKALVKGANYVFSTDADSTVSPGWAIAMWRILSSDFARVEKVGSVWGSVQLSPRSPYSMAWEAAREKGNLSFRLFEQNCGFTSEAYWAAGGWGMEPKGEGPALLRRLRAAGYGELRIPEAMVTTSDRAHGRVRGGMAETIRNLSLDGKLSVARLLA